MVQSTDFINRVKNQAMKDMNKHGICASVTIAQAIIESGWGGSGLATRYNNLFGIKDSKSWQGKIATLETSEWVEGRYIKVKANFRAYDNWEESIADHTKFLLTNPRYARLIGVNDYKQTCNILQDCGYATSPTYAQSLIKVIETYDLMIYDNNIIIEGWFKTMDIKTLQRVLNSLGFKDQNGKVLVVDGSEGAKTKYAKQQAKEIMSYILK